MITQFKLFENNEENINIVLDKIKQQGIGSLTRIEKRILKNRGDLQPSIKKQHYDSGNFEFDLSFDEDYGNFDKSVKVHGYITYKKERYHGYFEFYEDGRYEWYFDNLEPDADDFYDLDSLTQEVEGVFITLD